MQDNVKNYLEEDNNQRFDGRETSLNTPTHGKVPRWLTDMSSHVERSHSAQSKRNQIGSNNNEILIANQHFSLFDMQKGSTSTSSSRSNSARFGRRSSQSQYENTNISKKKNVQLDLDSYIVPKMEDVNFSNFVHLNHYGFKPLHSESTTVQTKSNLKNFVDKDESTSTTESYSPSLLDDEKSGSGRRSRLNQIDSRLNDLSLNDRQHLDVADFIPVHFKSNSNPEPTHYKTLNEYFHKKDDAYLKTTNSSNSLDVHLIQGQLNNSKVCHVENDFNNYEGLGPNPNSRTNFEEDFLMVKNKLQQRRKRYKSYKKSKSKFVVRHDHSFTDIPSSYLNNTTGNAPNMRSNQVFIIPELPAGTIMIVDILSTWGDKFYVGLNGVELFDSEGNIVPVRKITACPEDINILPHCHGDPRVVTNLLDGINRTQDDMHLWLTPFDSGEHHLIILEFFKKTELGMVRIWNYNKSRIHSFRGAKDVVITLDGICVFRGEIAQACGSILGGIQSFGDTILFTTEEHILEKIAINDIAFSTLIADVDKQTLEHLDRPPTATGVQESQQRPYTHAYTNANKNDSDPSEQLFGVHRIDIILILNWSKSDYIGLTGLEVIGDSGKAILVSKENFRCNDLTASAMLQRLVDNENITVDRKHMWYTQYIPDQEIVISILFEKLTYIAGMRFWNYNENLEMSFCGVRMIKIYMDSKPAINPLTNDCTFLLRRAPGNTHYDYVQEIKLSRNNLIDVQHEPFYELNNSATPKEELFENPIMPEGYVFQIVIYTTWGDQYYVGLNGLEMFDQHGNRIILTENNICAHPESVNVLPGVSGDVRTPDKLIDGVNDRSDASHSWLVPVIPKCLNRIYVVFDQPMTISVMKIWNYLKTPTRGVKEFGILVDDLLIYNGILDKIHDKSSVKYRTILFTNNKNVLQKEMASLVKHSIDSQATILTNEEPRVTTGGSLPNADQSLRPFTSVNYLNRERTSQSN